MPPTTPPPRLSILFARKASWALILRRGPSKWVELISWDTKADSFERGHWFHGRIYERRSDLSPDGRLLVAFLSKFTGKTVEDTEYTYAWTAVSRPPWLTALALWPKGDCWWGGGLFAFNRTLMLNHRPGEDAPHPQHRPKGLRVSPNPDAHGEDDPLYSQRLERDGWYLRQDWVLDRTWQEGFKTLRPQVRERQQPGGQFGLRMSRGVSGFRHVDRFALLSPDGDAVSLPVQWADWDQSGRLVMLEKGTVRVAEAEAPKQARTLADLSADRPFPIAAPAWAAAWPW